MSRIWFTDRDLGKQFPAILSAAGLAVERRAHAHESPFIAKLYRPTPGELAKTADAAGRVELWYPQR